MSIQRFRKKPVVIEAMRYSIDRRDLLIAWIENSGGEVAHQAIGEQGDVYDLENPRIVTLEGQMRVTPGDWVIRGVQGEFYPCKPDIFDATYEAVE